VNVLITLEDVFCWSVLYYRFYHLLFFIVLSYIYFFVA